MGHGRFVRCLLLLHCCCIVLLLLLLLLWSVVLLMWDWFGLDSSYSCVDDEAEEVTPHTSASGCGKGFCQRGWGEWEFAYMGRDGLGWVGNGVEWA